MMPDRKRISIGTEDFAEFIQNGDYLVDKTDLIRTLLSSRSKVTLFTRPRRFGKTLTMSMLKYFFEIGRILPCSTDSRSAGSGHSVSSIRENIL